MTKPQPKALKKYWANKKAKEPKPEFTDKFGRPTVFNPKDDEFNRKARKKDFEIFFNANKRNQKGA